MRVLILCTGNSCRSQMAAGFLASFDSTVEVHSAGTYPASYVQPKAIEVMREAGIDISKATPKNVKAYLKQPFDYVITVCDDAKETCPVFSGSVGRRLHMGFYDPSFASGTDEQILAEFRTVRDQIRARFEAFYRMELLPDMKRE
jgi:arsenate reductase